LIFVIWDLPPDGAVGEMVLNVGAVSCLALRGVDGILDISPFTCMNGIVSEAIYPRVSADLGGLPVRNLYFDGTASDLDLELGVFVEMARTYHSAGNRLGRTTRHRDTAGAEVPKRARLGSRS